MNRAFSVPFVLAFLFLLTCPVYATTLYVDASVPQSGDGRAWQTALKTIQEGIDAASEGDTVVVAAGVYVDNINFGGKNIVLSSTDPLDPDIVAATTIDGDEAASVVTFDGTENDTCVLSGFTLRNGQAADGGGICGGTLDAQTHATIRNNVVMGNLAVFQPPAYGTGGGIAFCAGVIRGNTVTGNSARLAGGLGVCNGAIENNTVSGNTASLYGGGVGYCDGTIRGNSICDNYGDNAAGGLQRCEGLIEGNLIMGNFTHWDGGGLNQCNGTIRNNLIVGNVVWGLGSGLSECNGTIQSNTICHNRDASGGALYYCRAAITNCIIWGNCTVSGCPQLYHSNEPTYSCIEGWRDGGTNTDTDPSFLIPGRWDDNHTPDDWLDDVWIGGGDYRLRPDSPCIDAGFNDPGLPAKDIAGMRRIMYGGTSLTVDMGAYEYYINELNRGPGSSETTLTWSSIASSTYVILYSEDLLIWILADAGVPSAGNQTTSWTDDGSKTGLAPTLAPLRFYRVLENQ